MLYCDHESYCNRCTKLRIHLDETPRDGIKRSDWEIVDGERRCEEHK